MSNTISSFDTYWKETGSLQPEIFSLPYDQRELYRLVAQAAWQWRDDEIKELESALEESETGATSFADEAIEEVDDIQSEADNLKDSVEELIEKIDTVLSNLQRARNRL